MKIISVVGARPNFMKIAPILPLLDSYRFKSYLVHTGQHYDENMSKIFFKQLELPPPDYFLGIGSASHANQTAQIMIKFEKICLNINPDLVIVAGDVNSTLACALVASKLNIKIAHVESGLRSFDNQMPEEINRIITDRISDFLFITEKSAKINLINEGIDNSKIFFVGNCMIDSLIQYEKKIDKNKVLNQFQLKENKYCLVTLHRPSNVDSLKKLNDYILLFNKISLKQKIIFPIHPRTKLLLSKLSCKISDRIILIDPLPYIEFLTLMKYSRLIISDSGGIQEETTYLGKQCLTVRNNTERPITIELGTNHLVGSSTKECFKFFNKIISGEIKSGKIPPKWDGYAAKRIVEIIKDNIK